MGVKESLEQIAAGGAVPPDFSVSYGVHVLGMTGMARWTIVGADGRVRERTMRMGTEAQESDVARVGAAELRALAGVLARSRVDQMRPTPGAVTDMHSAMNRKTTIDVAIGGAKAEVEIPTEEAEKREDVKAIAAALERAKSAPAAPAAPVARPVAPPAPAAAKSSNVGIIVVVALAALFPCGLIGIAVKGKRDRENAAREFEERVAREKAEKEAKYLPFRDRVVEWGSLVPAGEGGEPRLVGAAVIVEKDRKNDVLDEHFLLAEPIRAKTAAEVGTIVRVRRQNEEVGQYEGGGAGFVQIVEVTLIEAASKRLIAKKTFRGGDPPPSKRKGDDNAYGSSPFPEVLDWLAKLPRQ